MDPVILAGMIFSIIVLLLVGGFVLLLPVSQRLGKVLDIWISEHKSLPWEVGRLVAWHGG